MSEKELSIRITFFVLRFSDHFGLNSGLREPIIAVPARYVLSVDFHLLI